MRSVRPCLLALSLLSAAVPAAAQAPAVSIQFHNGNVTLQARNAPLRTILQEWARVGKTTIVNIERVAGTPMTLELTDVPEGQAVATLLRGAGGYIVGARQVASTGPSSFDRIMIVPASPVTAAPRVVSAPIQTLPPPPAPVAFIPGDANNDVPPDGAATRVITAQQLQNQINARTAGVRAEPVEPATQPAPTPQPTPGVRGNPIFTGPSGRPGEVAPAPQQSPRNPLRPNGDPEP
jgi:hypothetical protein